MSTTEIGIIFDGDDTLWTNQTIYIQAKKKFFHEMAALGFNPYEVERRFEKIDIDNVSYLGFSLIRFPKSMSDTYKIFCMENNRSCDDLVLRNMEDIGHSTFKKKPKMFDGVIQVLQKLNSQNLNLILATKGDRSVQENKISILNLKPYFHHIYFLPEKGDREFSIIAKECNLNPHMSWSIGNSIKSDINPALRIGMQAILLKRKTWEFEEEVPFEKERLFKARSMRNAYKILKTHIIGI